MKGSRIASSHITRSVELFCGWRIGEYLHWIPKSGRDFLHSGLANCLLAHNALGRIILRVADRGVTALDTQIGQRFCDMQGSRIARSRITRSVELLCGWRIVKYLHWIPKSASDFGLAGLAICELAQNSLSMVDLRVSDYGVSALDTQIGQRFALCRVRELQSRA
jgi:hypothetical protein